MIERLINFLSFLPKEIIVILIAMLPISELRGAIPVAITVFNFSITKSFFLALTGNFLFVIPLLLFLNNLHIYFMKLYWYNKFFTWWMNKIKARSKIVEEFKFLGLIIFVGIPLPMTGAWSGCVASYLLGIKFWHAVLGCFLGILIAGIIVTLTTIGITEITQIFIHR